MPPTLSTNPVTWISTTYATSGGNITNSGNAAVTERGVCWNTTGAPTISDSKLADAGTGSGAYSLQITGLTAGTTYYLRAYAVNSAGVGYGDEVTFTTLATLVTPTVSTDSVTSIVYKTAKIYATVSDWGGSEVTERGVCWSTSENPTIADEYTANGSGLGSFSTTIGGLSLSTTYYVRAYAINSTGISYGSQLSFTTPDPQPDVYKVVDKNGTPGVNCNYTTVQAAFDDVPTNYTGRWIIFVRKGTYYEKLLLASGKINVVLIGEDADSTILTYDDYAGKNAGSTGTSTSYSVAIDASDFEARNITFRNTANAYAPGSTATQAVALRTNGDRMEFYNCKMLGYQDTYYTWSAGRSYHKNCYVEGAVDFIFGRTVAVFDSSIIFCNRNGGVLTAASTDPGYKFGYVFLNSIVESTPAGEKGCDSTAMVSFYLGRPWQQEPRTVFLNCYEPATLNSAGWTVMGPAAKLFAEYNCFGPGAVSSPRPIIWTLTNQPSLLSAAEAAEYTLSNIFSKSTAPTPYSENWMPSKEVIDYAQIETIIGGPLPVQLTTATVTAVKQGVLLQWSTATEVNCAGFTIERKIAGATEWKFVNFVEGHGTSNVPQSYSYTDCVPPGNYMYRLIQLDVDGSSKIYVVGEVEVGSAPYEFSLSQNYPNPFNPKTQIEFTVEKTTYATLTVYNVLGQKVATLFSGEAKAGQYHQVAFDGMRFSSGVYYYILEADGKRIVKRMSLLK